MIAPPASRVPRWDNTLRRDVLRASDRVTRSLSVSRVILGKEIS